MTSGQKVAVSLLVSVVLFAVFTVAAFAGLFNFIEVKFYQPKVVGGIEERLEKISDAQNRYVDSLFKRFDSFVADESVRTYLESRPDDNFVQTREKLRVNLMMDTRALKGIRIIDPVGINILYSSFSSDIMSSSDSKTTYKKYSDLINAKTNPELHYADIKVGDIRISSYGNVKQNRIFFDEEQNRVIFSMPFYDGSEKYAGTIAFYCDPSDFSRFLFEENLIDITGFGFLISDSDGFGGYVFGLSNVGRTSLKNLILEQWEIDSKSNSETVNSGFTVRNIVPKIDSRMLEGEEKPSEIDEKYSEVKILFSKKSSRDDLGFTAWIYDKDIMYFPQAVKFLLLVLTFLTLFLIIYLVFNFRHDDMVVIKKRIKQFQLSFVTESLENFDKNTGKFLDFEEKKERINKEIKNSLGSRGRKFSKEIDALLDSSWTDLFKAMGMRSDGKVSAAVDSEELRRVLEEVLGSGNVKINAVSLATPQSSEISSSNPTENSEHTEEIAVPESSETSEITEKVEEAESSEEVENTEEVTEAEAVEEIEEIEEVEEAESPDELEGVEEVESAEEVTEAEIVEEIEEVEEAESPDELESVEEVESAEEVTEAETVEEIEEIEEAEEAESAEDVSDNFVVESPNFYEEIESAESSEEYITLEKPAADRYENYEKLEELEDVDVSYFGVTAKSYNFNDDPDFFEPLVFGSPAKATVGDDESEKIVENFAVSNFDFSMLDEIESTDEKIEETEKNEETEKIEEVEEIEEVQSLDKKSGSSPFSLTGFSSLGNATEVVSE